MNKSKILLCGKELAKCVFKNSAERRALHAGATLSSRCWIVKKKICSKFQVNFFQKYKTCARLKFVKPTTTTPGS